MNITNKLNRKITILEYNNKENEFGEVSYGYQPLKTIYSQIIPIKNTSNDLSEQSEQIKAQYKFVIRKKSLSNILLTMRIMFESQEFSIDYYNVDYRDNEYIEIFATKVVQL